MDPTSLICTPIGSSATMHALHNTHSTCTQDVNTMVWVSHTCRASHEWDQMVPHSNWIRENILLSVRIITTMYCHQRLMSTTNNMDSSPMSARENACYAPPGPRTRNWTSDSKERPGPQPAHFTRMGGGPQNVRIPDITCSWVTQGRNTHLFTIQGTLVSQQREQQWTWNLHVSEMVSGLWNSYRLTLRTNCLGSRTTGFHVYIVLGTSSPIPCSTIPLVGRLQYQIMDQSRALYAVKVLFVSIC